MGPPQLGLTGATRGGVLPAGGTPGRGTLPAGPGWGTPPPGWTWPGYAPCGQTDGWMDGQTRVKTLPSRRTTYAVGNKVIIFMNRWESTDDRSAFYTPPSSMHQSSGSDLSNLRFQGSRVSGVSSSLDGGTMHPNSSASSADSYMDRSFYFQSVSSPI